MGAFFVCKEAAMPKKILAFLIQLAMLLCCLIQPIPAAAGAPEEMNDLVNGYGRPTAVLVYSMDGTTLYSYKAQTKLAGASAIVVSNHGGRVLDQCPATAEVLSDIASEVGGDVKVLVDGGIRSGVDIFKALALGADGVLIARPYVTAVYGGAAEGVALYTEKLGAELADTMKMCGTPSLEDIGIDNIYR